VVVGGGMDKHPNDGGGNSTMEDDQHFMHCFDYIVQVMHSSQCFESQPTILIENLGHPVLS
jgi:hypothetical protein